MENRDLFSDEVARLRKRIEEYLNSEENYVHMDKAIKAMERLNSLLLFCTQSLMAKYQLRPSDYKDYAAALYYITEAMKNIRKISEQQKLSEQELK